MFYKKLFYTILLLLLIPTVSAIESMKGDSKHAQVWNKFANDTLSLHKKLKKNKKLDVKSSKGSYANQKDFYLEQRYYENGHLISQLQWEKDQPTRLHTIEVYVRDKKNRVVRDFMAAYLPHYRNAPSQTLVSFHYYNRALHAFRSFDASGSIVLERCEGKDKHGKEIHILLDEDELENDPDNLIGSKVYKNCFSGLKQKKLGKYIIPH